MTDVETVVDGYIAMWNEPDPARRRALVARTWAEDASYVDPLMSGEGHEGIDAMVAAAQGAGEPVAVGVDFATMAADGRLRAVTGFLEAVAA